MESAGAPPAGGPPSHEAVRARPVPPREIGKRIRALLPSGRAVPEDTWRRRHKGIRVLAFAQAAGLVVFGLVRGYTLGHVLLESSIVAAAAAVAGRRRLGRTGMEAVATFALVSTSALLVHFSGGTIEAHFHFFVMLAVISSYQAWTPFLLAIVFVVVHHGVTGAIDPHSVYNHPAAWAHPWVWALIHGIFVLGAAAAYLVNWRLNEQADRETNTAVSLLVATLESTADGILVVDGDGAISSFNRRFVEMWRIPQDVIDSRSDDAALSSVLAQLKDPQGFIAKVMELYATPDASSFDMLEFIDGRMFERYSLPQLVDGVAVGRVWSFRDVTERARLDEMRNSFLSAVSHEMRTPLTSVMGCAATLRAHDEILTDDERRDMLDRLTSGAHKLSRLLTDLLDLDRLERGILEPSRAMTDVGSLVRATVLALDAPGGRTIVVDQAAVWAEIDAPKVERIVENLLINSGRHTPPGTPTWVRVTPVEGHGALIVVEDAGPGVPDEIKATIFEPFRQGRVEAHSPGVGVGLSLVARFAALHGGRAWVEDRPGGGASFHVLLPGPHAKPDAA